eukprot:752506-Hanusia_phi.AAC.13
MMVVIQGGLMEGMIQVIILLLGLFPIDMTFLSLDMPVSPRPLTSSSSSSSSSPASPASAYAPLPLAGSF